MYFLREIWQTEAKELMQHYLLKTAHLQFLATVHCINYETRALCSKQEIQSSTYSAKSQKHICHISLDIISSDIPILPVLNISCNNGRQWQDYYKNDAFSCQKMSPHFTSNHYVHTFWLCMQYCSSYYLAWPANQKLPVILQCAQLCFKLSKIVIKWLVYLGIHANKLWLHN